MPNDFAILRFCAVSNKTDQACSRAYTGGQCAMPPTGVKLRFEGKNQQKKPVGIYFSCFGPLFGKFLRKPQSLLNILLVRYFFLK